MGIPFQGKLFSKINPFPRKGFSRDAYSYNWREAIMSLGENPDEQCLFLNGRFDSLDKTLNKVLTERLDAVVLFREDYEVTKFKGENCSIDVVKFPRVLAFKGYGSPLQSRIQIMVVRHGEAMQPPPNITFDSDKDPNVGILKWQRLSQTPDSFEIDLFGKIAIAVLQHPEHDLPRNTVHLSMGTSFHMLPSLSCSWS